MRRTATLATGRDAPAGAVAALLALSLLVAACSGTTATSARTADVGTDTGAATVDDTAGAADPTTTSTASSAASSTTAPTGAAPAPPADGLTSAERTMKKVHVITGGLTPKSIVHSGTGQFVAQNMVYSHTVNVYDRSFEKVATVDDRVTLAEWGFPQYEGTHQGGPVEAAFTTDGSKVYVTNYQMYGKGFSKPGADKCAKGNWDPSFVYRIDMTSHAIDQVIEVGPVPKYVATTPDGKYVLVTNWCGYDMSVIDVGSAKEVQRVPLGRYPRGIAVAPDSSTAYVAVMGSSDIAKVDLGTFGVGWIRNVGAGPRHLVIDGDGKYLYSTLNAAGAVAKIDLADDSVVAKVPSPSQPRTMVLSDDGSALYVVNYASDAMSKIRTSDMQQVQRVPTNHHPIGVTYDAATRRIWVACYSGSVMVFDDVAPG